MCKSRGKSVSGRPTSKQGKFHKVHQMVEHSLDDSPGVEELSLYNLSMKLVSKSYWVGLRIENIPVEMELDTGAAVAISPIQQFKELFSEVEISPSSVKLITYAGNEVPVAGQVVVKVAYRNQTAMLPIKLVDIGRNQQPMLLGRNWLAKLKLDWQTVFECKAVEAVKGRPKPNLSVSNML